MIIRFIILIHKIIYTHVYIYVYAFKDGVLSKEDLTSYINLITAEGLTGDSRRDNDVEMIVDQLLDESYNGQEARGDSITFQNFHRIMITMDFQSKMRIPI